MGKNAAMQCVSSNFSNSEVMLVCYGLIVRRLQSTSIPVNARSTKSSSTGSAGNIPAYSKKSKGRSQSSKDRRRVTIMCASLVVCFIMCWLPYHSVKLAQIAGMGTSKRTCRKLHFMGSLFAFLNSAANPCLYTFFAANFSQSWRTATATVRQCMGTRSLSSTNVTTSGKVRLEKKNSTKKEHRNLTTTTETNRSSSKTGFETISLSTPMKSVSSYASNHEVGKNSLVANPNVDDDTILEIQ